jgi:hypothetical protein
MAIQKELEPTILPLPGPLANKWPYDLVEIIWDDATTDHGWEGVSEIELGGELVTTIGFLIKQNRQYVMVGASIYCDDSGEHSFNARVQIPKGMIKKQTILVKKNVGKTKTKTSETP